jgi:hypothetical protein
MTGKILSLAILFSALIAGAALYYLQVYAFYDEVPPPAPADIVLTPVAGGAPDPLPFDAFRGIDATSSPIRYRACFSTPLSLATLSETYMPYPDAEPLNAPGWFACFDANAIADGLRSGTALAFLSEENIGYGVDRVIVVFDDGRAYAWHQLNDCGEKAYDGTPVGDACPPRPTEDAS